MGAVALIVDRKGVRSKRPLRACLTRIRFRMNGRKRSDPTTIDTVIEVKGCYWHGCSQCGYNDEWHLEKRQRDATREAYLQEEGYQVKEIWEHEFEHGGAVALVSMLAEGFQEG